MLKRLWQWLKRLIQRLFPSKQTVSPLLREQKTVEIIKQLTDTEYESLFLQLLAEVNDGLARGGVKGFLVAKRINEGNLVEWLRGFGERLLASTAGNDELAAQMVRFGELGVGEVGDVARDIGRRLTNRRGAENAEEGEGGETKAWLNQGNEQFIAGDFAGAIASYDNAINIKPDYHEAWNNRGSALHNLGRNKEAMASYDKALEIQADFHQAWYNRGVVLGKLGRDEKAIASYDKALEFQPDYHEAWNNRGSALNNLGRDEEAIASYDKALEIQADFHQAWHNRGVVLGNLRRNEEAIASYDKALEFQPDYHYAWHNRGAVLGNLRRNKEAIASYDKALEFQPDYHYAWHNRGAVLGNLRRNEEAIASYDKALEFQPDYHEAWNNRGSALNNLGQYEEAITSFDNALKFQPDFHETWNNRGAALNNLGRYEEAIASFDKALKITSDYDTAWNNRGLSLGNLGRHEEAIASFDKALKITSDYDTAWNNRGLSLGNLGRHEEAIASFDKALKFKLDFHEAWNNRGAALNNLGRYEEAIASYDNAIKFQPDFHVAWYKRGDALRNLGRYEEAIASYDNAIKFQPDFHVAWHNRGASLNELGRYEEAIASYENALKSQPDFHAAWNNRGVALLNLGRNEEAIASYENALKFKRDYHEAWNNRGNVLGNLGRYEEAIASYNHALEIKTDYYESWNNRGNSLFNLRRYEEAIASFDNALQFKQDYQVAWCNRGVAARNSVSCNQLLVLSSSIARENPQLNQRGYEGELASYEEGLKYFHKDTHREGGGLLHQAIGYAHYFRGRRDSYPRSYWHKAVKSYNEALKTLTEVDFPELHLEVLQNLIRVQSDLGETAKAEELQRRGTDLLRRLLNEPNRPDQSKKQLALKFAWLQQLTVDLAVQSGQLLQAVELAEQGKNACLSWLLDGWSDEISSPSYSAMQQLLNPTTAIVYWHLSYYALHTFILKHDTPEPIVLGETGVLNQPQRLRDFEDWLKKWNQQYADYRQGKKGEPAGTWRDNLPEMLQSLGDILDINAIVSHIPDITQLILIPHRDLHRLPLHALFPPELMISYLPSVQIGLIPLTPLKKGGYELYKLLNVEHPTSAGYPSLEFAQIESQAISRMFANPSRQRSEEATKAAVLNALRQSYNIFHFTGHGIYNFHNPVLSHLALAGEDKLTLVDIRHFDLSSYQLVSLAACETAITGNHTITAEYVGLVSGFMSCGVAHVLSTLWTVESEASALVMMQFYNLLQQGKSKAVALAEATQWLRNVTNAQLAEWYAGEIDKLPAEENLVRRFLSRHLDNLKNQQQPSKQPYNHPYFWSAFTITGIFPIDISRKEKDPTSIPLPEAERGFKTPQR